MNKPITKVRRLMRGVPVLVTVLFAVALGCGTRVEIATPVGAAAFNETRQFSAGGKDDPNAAGRGGQSSLAVELGISIRQEVGRQMGDEVESSVDWVDS